MILYYCTGITPYLIPYFVDRPVMVKLCIISTAVYGFGLYMLLDQAIYHILLYIIEVTIISGIGIVTGFDTINRLINSPYCYFRDVCNSGHNASYRPYYGSCFINNQSIVGENRKP